MDVTVLYFAAARERAGTVREKLSLPEGALAGDVLATVARAHPALASLVGRLRVAVNHEFARDDRPLSPGDEVAIVPPVSGGAGMHRLSPEPLDPLGAPRRVEAGGKGHGAVVTFTGTVRDSSGGRRVLRLEYEAYPAMVLRVFDAIAAECAERWPGARVAIDHRVGTVEVGALAVVVAAAAPHRAEAFEACRHAIERLKHDAPIWKREVYEDGSSWVGLGP